MFDTFKISLIDILVGFYSVVVYDDRLQVLNITCANLKYQLLCLQGIILTKVLALSSNTAAPYTNYRYCMYYYQWYRFNDSAVVKRLPEHGDAFKLHMKLIKLGHNGYPCVCLALLCYSQTPVNRAYFKY